MIYHWSPDNTRKMLVNIRKTQERLKKKKKDTVEEEDDEDKEHFTTQPERSAHYWSVLIADNSIILLNLLHSQ